MLGLRLYLPLPVAAVEGDEEGSHASFKATFESLVGHSGLRFCGASVTLPHKQNAARLTWFTPTGREPPDVVRAINTVTVDRNEAANDVFDGLYVENTDVIAIRRLVSEIGARSVVVVGAGGVARAAVYACGSAGAHVFVANRSQSHAEAVAADFAKEFREQWDARVSAISRSEIVRVSADVYINCTPVGMTGGPDPDGMSIPVDDIKPAPETVFFDTVYNPIETPMLKAAKRWGCRTIDGVEMFVRQAALQFELWTGRKAPTALFDRLVRERLS